MSETALPGLHDDEYGLRLRGRVGSLAEAVGALPENGWQLVSIELRDDTPRTHTMRVRPAHEHPRQPWVSHPRTLERGR